MHSKLMASYRGIYDAIYAEMSFLSPQPKMRALTEGYRLAITFLRAGSY
jgi:hypothetical protein